MKSTLLIFCLLLATPVVAETTLHHGSVSATWEVFLDATGYPSCGVWWQDFVAEGEVYENTSYQDEEPCRSQWLVHCSADSLSYLGAWATAEPTQPYWNYCYIDFIVEAELEFSEAVRVYAQSRSEGVLVGDIHRVVLIPHGGDEQLLLGPGPGGSLELDLDPGTYTLAIVVDATEQYTHHEYDGSLRVWWLDLADVPTQHTSWSAVKAIYR